ncbi:MAG: hypothetical protein LBF19_00525 [Prevotellaceae bacterium]|jgi:hypothetical protein|nr:hypothetical protein [Prevotellaceae bacterium]
MNELSLFDLRVLRCALYHYVTCTAGKSKERAWALLDAIDVLIERKEEEDTQ